MPNQQASDLPKHVIPELARMNAPALFLKLMTPLENVKSWREFGPADIACDVSAGEVSLDHASASVADLEKCKILCQSNAACRSITYFANGWCNLYSTLCTNTRSTKNAFAMYLIADSGKPVVVTGTSSSNAKTIHALVAIYTR